MHALNRSISAHVQMSIVLVHGMQVSQPQVRSRSVKAILNLAYVSVISHGERLRATAKAVLSPETSRLLLMKHLNYYNQFCD